MDEAGREGGFYHVSLPSVCLMKVSMITSICILPVEETETNNPRPHSNVVNGGEEIKTFLHLTPKSTLFQLHISLQQFMS